MTLGEGWGERTIMTTDHTIHTHTGCFTLAKSLGSDGIMRAEKCLSVLMS